ncbi:MAG: ABC transporter ATP-binding protein [Acholeplasmatales bacterium]|nr:ABC transporter ATP-binding protein [Acholeplasmatales bacterium]
MKKYIFKYWYYAIWAPIFMLGEVFMDLLQPKLMVIIVDDGVLGVNNNGVGDIDIVIKTGLLMIGLVIIGAICGVLSGVFANLCTQKFAHDLRVDCFKRVMNLSFEQTDNFSTGSLVTRVTNDVTQVQNMLAQLMRGFVRTFSLFLGGIIFMLMLDLSFGAVLAVSMPLVIIFVLVFILKARPKFKILQAKIDNLNSIMQENVTGARVIKAYVKEEYEIERFNVSNEELIDVQSYVLKLFSFMSPISNLILNMTIVIIIYIGNINVKEATGVTPGNIMAAITYTSQILNAVLRMANLFQTISRAQASAVRINQVLDCLPVITDGEFAFKTNIKGKLELRNVSFAYPDSPSVNVLEDISLTINPGETIGILGSIGSGKSSLVNLFPRFYDCTKGEVLIDDINVKDYKLDILRNKISIALQKSELFSTTIFENITWGKEDATLDQVKHAAKIAQASSFIEAKEEGYFTLVAEKGMSLSGGQKQRINIARCILKNSEILIFDDSTSALDLKTESLLYKDLKSEYSDTTKIIIAQRIASVKDADRIVVLDKGRIANVGNHNELIENSPIYQEIYNSQLKGGVVND